MPQAKQAQRLCHVVQAITMVRERLQKKEEPEAICKAMCDHCMAPDTQVRRAQFSSNEVLLAGAAVLESARPVLVSSDVPCRSGPGR